MQPKLSMRQLEVNFNGIFLLTNKLIAIINI